MPIEQEHSIPTHVNEQTARAIALLRSRLSNFETEHGRLLGLSYQPVESDEVVITTSPKAGTTWLQQICHQLRVAFQYGHGDDQFEEISQVVPWLELAFDQGQDLYAPQHVGGGRLPQFTMQQQQQLSSSSQLQPRLFKTHAWQLHCPARFHKVIVGVRDPIDVVMSFYYFFQGWFFPSDPNDKDWLSLEEFVRHFWLARGTPASKMENASYFVHLMSWYQAHVQQLEQQSDQQVPKQQILFVFYEDLKDNLEEQVRRIASFLSTDEYNFADMDDDLIQLVVELSSFTYMKQHEHLFDEKLSKLARNEACGLSAEAGFHASKLRFGRSSSLLLMDGSSATATTFASDPQRPWRQYYLQEEISLELQDEIQQQWTNVVYPVTKCETYADFRRHMKQLAKPKGAETTTCARA